MARHKETSIDFTNTNVWNHKEIIINDVLAFIVATDILNNHDLQTTDEYRQMHDWPQWTEAITVELTSPVKREVHWPVVQTHEDINVGYKWVFVRKCNEHNKIIRYKAWLVVQSLL